MSMRDGRVNPDDLQKAITPKTGLASGMMVNNEVGVVQPIKELVSVCKKQGVWLHTDAAQALVRVPIDVEDLGVNIMSLSGHKCHDPMGIGGIYVSGTPVVRLEALFNSTEHRKQRNLNSIVKMYDSYVLIPRLRLVSSFMHLYQQNHKSRNRQYPKSAASIVYFKMDMNSAEPADSPQVQRDVTQQLLEKLKRYVISPDKFTNISQIGKGAFGVVTKARYNGSGGHIVALKKMDLNHDDIKATNSFCSEVEILAKGQNYFLLPFYSFWPKSPYTIVTEYVANGSLHDALMKRSSVRLGPADKLVIMLGVARGMLALHRMKVIHRDLKSLNILLDDDKLPKICDFGLSKFVEEHTSGMTMSVGTPHWMAPELFESDSYTDKVDVYAFAVLLWEVLTETAPFPGLNAYQVAAAICQKNERPALPENIPENIRTFLALTWNTDPKVRPNFAQICLALAQKQLRFNGDATASSIKAFMKKFPFTTEECADFEADNGSASPEFADAFPPPDGWDARKFFDKRSRVNITSNPLLDSSEGEGGLETLVPWVYGDGDSEEDEDEEDTRSHNRVSASGDNHSVALGGIGGTGLAKARGNARIDAPVSAIIRRVVKNVWKVEMGPIGVDFDTTRNVFLSDIERIPRPVAYNVIPKDHLTLEKNNIFLREDDNSSPDALVDRLKRTTSETADSTFKSARFTPSSVKVYSALATLLTANKAVVSQFVSCGCLSTLCYSDVAVFNYNISILCACVNDSHRNVGTDATETLVKLGADKIGPLLDLLAAIVRIPSTAHEAVGAIRVYLNNAEMFMKNIEFAEKYVRYVFKVATIACLLELRPLCVNIFMMGVETDNKGIIMASCNALCHMKITENVNTAVMTRLLAESEYQSLIVDVLARVTKLQAPERMVEMLVEIGDSSQMTILCLANIAATPEGCLLLAKHDGWMMNTKTADALKLFFLVCKPCAPRSVLMQSRKVGQLLGRAIREDSAVLVPVAHMMDAIFRDFATEKLVQDLSDAGFFASFVPGSLQKDEDCREICVTLIDCFSRICWVDGLSVFIQYLPYIFKLGGRIAAMCLTPCQVILLSRRDYAAPYLRAYPCINELRNCQVDPDYEQQKGAVLAGIASIAK